MDSPLLLSANLLVLLLCIASTRSQETSATLSTRNEIACTVINNDDGMDLFNYDCSHKELDWPSLDHLIDHIRASSNLNLASNRFDPVQHTIYNMSLNLFQLLTNTLNLSSNQFERAESHAFYYMQNFNLEPLRFKHLDLSNNWFESVPWDALRQLPMLESLHFNGNPLRSLNIDKLVLSTENRNRYFD